MLAFRVQSTEYEENIRMELPIRIVCGAVAAIGSVKTLDVTPTSTNNQRMNSPPKSTSTATTWALRKARRAWRIQFTDSSSSIVLARQALARAIATGDIDAQALPLLENARQLFTGPSARRGSIAAGV